MKLVKKDLSINMFSSCNILAAVNNILMKKYKHNEHIWYICHKKYCLVINRTVYNTCGRY